MHGAVETTKTTTAISIAMAIGALLGSANVSAQEGVPSHPMMSDRYFFSLGAYYPRSNTQGTLNSGTVGVGTFIDFENDFGLEERQLVGQVMFRMRLSERWRVEADYFKIERDKDRSLSRTIDFGNLNLSVNADIKSRFSFEDIRIGIGYSFFRSQDKEVGIGLGIHRTEMEASLETSTGETERASTSAPLPTITVYSQVALTHRWLLGIRIDQLSLDTGEVDGSVSSNTIEFVYQPWRNVNMGLGYRSVSLRMSSTGDDWRGQAQIQQNGPMLYLGTTF